MSQAIINAIKDLLPAYKNATVKRDAQNLRYLIGQLVRQYHIPSVNWHISAAARDRWDALTTAITGTFDRLFSVADYVGNHIAEGME